MFALLDRALKLLERLVVAVEQLAEDSRARAVDALQPPAGGHDGRKQG